MVEGGVSREVVFQMEVTSKLPFEIPPPHSPQRTPRAHEGHPPSTGSLFDPPVFPH